MFRSRPLDGRCEFSTLLIGRAAFFVPAVRRAQDRPLENHAVHYTNAKERAPATATRPEKSTMADTNQLSVETKLFRYNLDECILRLISEESG